MHKTLKEKITVPLYDADVWLIVSDDMHAERVKMKDLFGEPPAEDSYGALTSYDLAGNFAMFFEFRKLSVEKLAHEVFHVTHRILEWTASNFDPGHHEQGAMLCAYLMSWVMKKTDSDVNYSKKYSKEEMVMTMKITVKNEEGERGRKIEVSTIVANDTTAVCPISQHVVIQRDIVEPGESREFWLHGQQYISVKEK